MTDAQVDRLTAAVEDCARQLGALARVASAWAQHAGVQANGKGGGKQQATSQARGGIATEREIDDAKYGDPKVVADPRNWQGQSYKGGRMSEAPADFLDELAEMLDDFADRETDDKKRKYKRSDAAKARAWARRKSKQEQPPPASTDEADL